MAAPSGQSGTREAMSSRVYEGYALAAPGANTNIISASIRFSRRASRCRVLVALTTGSVFNIRTTDGTTAYTTSLNAGAALVAACEYEFEFSVQSTTDGSETGTAVTYNFQVATDGVIRQLIVTEVTGPG